jgi:cyclopropane-fatty-acyl-phospholipid synthase
MMNQEAKKSIQSLLSMADIKIDGDRPWDIRIRDERFFRRVLADPTVGLGESYMDGWWECKSIDQLFYKILTARLDEKVKNHPRLLLHRFMSRLVNLQTRARSLKIAEKHYEFSTDLFLSFLDPYNQYTCGYFKDTEDLNKAQELKLDLICRKLKITSSDEVLDIGCGWGGFAKFASERYGCHVTGISISSEQVEYAKEFCKGKNVAIVKSDYRDLPVEGNRQRYDKVLICGMIEHVGYKNYRLLMKIVRHCLKDAGLFLLHTIGRNVSATTMTTNRWLAKYIFPNSMVPSMKQLSAAAEGLFVIEDLHNFRAYYDNTLMAWSKNFEKNWDKIKSAYDDRFYRMWQYYFLSCAGGFRALDTQLWQIVFSKHGVVGGYESVR